MCAVVQWRCTGQDCSGDTVITTAVMRTASRLSIVPLRVIDLYNKDDHTTLLWTVIALLSSATQANVSQGNQDEHKAAKTFSSIGKAAAKNV